MKIYIVRHGIAIDREDPSVESDAERQLTEVGLRRTRQVAEGLQALGVKIDWVLTSPLVRARETAEIMHEVLGVEEPLLETEALAPGFGAEDFKALCEGLDASGRLMIVGHEPDFSELVSTLVFGDERGDFVFKKAGVALLDTGDLPPEEGSVALRWFLPPKVLVAAGNS